MGCDYILHRRQGRREGPGLFAPNSLVPPSDYPCYKSASFAIFATKLHIHTLQTLPSAGVVATGLANPYNGSS